MHWAAGVHSRADAVRRDVQVASYQLADRRRHELDEPQFGADQEEQGRSVRKVQALSGRAQPQALTWRSSSAAI